MGSGLAIPLPLTGRQVRVTVQDRRARKAITADELADVHTHEGDEGEDVFIWFAYRDEEDRIARAVSPELSLVVERSTPTEAAAELEILMMDYIGDAVARGENRDQMSRLLPRDIFAIHTARLTRMLQRHREEFGTAWLAGHCHVSHAKVSTPTP